MDKSEQHIAFKKVVIVTSRFPYPLDKGDKLRIFNQLVELSKHVRITLICLQEKPLSQAAYDAVIPYCQNVHSFQMTKWMRVMGALSYFLSGKPMQVGYFFNQNIKDRIDWIIKELEPDHIHCHMIRMVPYMSFQEGINHSLDYMDSMVLNDMASQHLNYFGLSPLRYLERNRIASYESHWHNRFNHHFIISPRDKNYLAEAARDDIEILSNGVALDEVSQEGGIPKVYDLCFCGNLGYGPNRKAVEIILDKIHPSLPSLSLVVAGADASPQLSNHGNENITVLSPVDDMRDVYLKSRILIAPIFTGSGQQNKILEAMALGVPCLTTSFVNQSIGGKNGVEILVADDTKTFTESVKVLLSQPDLYAKITKNGRALVETHYSWSNNTKPLAEAILK